MSDIINSNINAILDRAEEPEKMIRLIVQEMEDTLVEVRSVSARVLADRKATARRLGDLRSVASDWEGKARLALSKGREDLARAALREKRELDTEITAVERELEATDAHIEQLNQEVGQLQQKLNDARAKKQAMAMRATAVESRIRVRRQVNREALDEAFHRFDRFERRMDDLESQLDAMDLGRTSGPGLAAELEALQRDEQLTAELDRLKAQLAEPPASGR